MAPSNGQKKLLMTIIGGMFAVILSLIGAAYADIKSEIERQHEESLAAHARIEEQLNVLSERSIASATNISSLIRVNGDIKQEIKEIRNR